MNRVWIRIGLSLLAGFGLCLLIGAAQKDVGSFLLTGLLLTGFAYGFTAVKDYLTAVLAKAGHYGMQSIFFRSLWGGIIVIVLSLAAFSVLLYAGSLCGWCRMAVDLYHEVICVPTLPESDYIELDPW